MRLAHVAENRVVGIYEEEGPMPTSFKGTLLPLVETPQPNSKEGFTFVRHFEIKEDRVDVMWTGVPLTTEQKAAEAVQQEATQLRAILTALRDGQGAAGDRLARLEKVVFFLCKNVIQL